MISDVFQILGAGGDMAVIGLFFLWSRIDKRMSIIETKQQICCGDKAATH